MKKLSIESLQKIENMHQKCAEGCSCKLLLGHVAFLQAMINIYGLAEKSRRANG